jgi:hypothetical protein
MVKQVCFYLRDYTRMQVNKTKFVSFKFINFSFGIYLLLFLKCLLASRLILHRLSKLLGLDLVITLISFVCFVFLSTLLY